jgi:hypothetical protein
MRSAYIRTNSSFVLGGVLTLLLGWHLLHAAAQTDARDDLQIEYAQARMALAEINLQQAEGINNRVRGAVAANVVNEYRRDVAVARRHLESLHSGREDDEFQLWLRRAEASHQSALAQWKSAKAVNARVPRAFDRLEVRRLELHAKLGRLLVEQGKALADAPRNDQVAWQLEVLANETQRLNEKVQRAQHSSGSHPYNSYWLY